MVFQFDGVQFVPERKDDGALYGWAYDVRMQQLLEAPSYVRTSDWDCEEYLGFKAGGDQGKSTSASAVYDNSIEACQQELTDTRLEISDQSFVFYESSCDIASETRQGDATVYMLNCYGEGDTWNIQATLRSASDGGVDLSIDGNTSHYVSCEK